MSTPSLRPTFAALAVTLLAIATGPAVEAANDGPSAPMSGNAGESCSPDGAFVPAGTSWLKCSGGTWQATTETPPPPPNGGSGGSSGSSSAKPAGIFKTVGVALSPSTFGSTGKQVADPTAWRMPDGKVRLFAFVNDSAGLPGLRVATSTNSAGTSFVNSRLDPFPGQPVGQPRAWALGGNSLRLFYVEGGGVNTAVSSDGGATFTDKTTVLTTEQAGFEPGAISVIKHKGGYRAYFSNLEKPGVRAERIMKTATSTDLVHWTVGPTVVSGGGSHPFAVTDKSGRVALYYAADRGTTYGIFVSTSKDGIHFAKEKFVMAGAGDPDIIAAGKGKYLMYYGADLGAEGFGVKVARSTGNVIP